MPTIYAIEDSGCRKKVGLFLEDPSNTELHSEIVDIIKYSDVGERSYKYADQLIEEAKLSLQPLEDNDCKRSLTGLADFIIARNN